MQFCSETLPWTGGATHHKQHGMQTLLTTLSRPCHEQAVQRHYESGVFEKVAGFSNEKGH